MSRIVPAFLFPILAVAMVFRSARRRREHPEEAPSGIRPESVSGLEPEIGFWSEPEVVGFLFDPDPVASGVGLRERWERVLLGFAGVALSTVLVATAAWSIVLTVVMAEGLMAPERRAEGAIVGTRSVPFHLRAAGKGVFALFPAGHGVLVDVPGIGRSWTMRDGDVADWERDGAPVEVDYVRGRFSGWMWVRSIAPSSPQGLPPASPSDAGRGP